MAERPDLDWVVQVTGGKLERYRRVEITGFSIDSRILRPGELFIALRGERTDGHLFLNEAFHRGASGALVSRDIEGAEDLHNIIRIEDTEAALQRLAWAWRDRFDVPIIGITGSAGKTTTKELLFAILEKKIQAYRSPGNYNTEYGLPLAILGMYADVEVGVFELGLQRPGEVGKLAEILEPTIGIITGIGDAHLGFFRDREELAESKWELIEQLSQNGLAVLNSDSPHLRERMGYNTPSPGGRELEGGGSPSPSPLPSRERDFIRNYDAISFGIEGEADYRASKIDDTSLKGLRFSLSSPQGSFRVESKLLGRFNVYNILAATAAALELGVKPNNIQQALRDFTPLPHRMELRHSRVGLIIDDSYNANPSSTEGALAALARLRTRRRKAFVFGDILELGEGALQAHREIAELIDELDIDLVFTLGELAGETGKALQQRGWGDERVLITNSMDELEGVLLSRLDDDQNLILIKGSRAMGLDQLIESLL